MAEIRVETVQVVRRYQILNIFKVRVSSGYAIFETKKSQRQIWDFCRRMGKDGEEEKDYIKSIGNGVGRSGIQFCTLEM